MENPAFRKFLKKLRPSYTPPNRKAIAGPLLDACYEGTKAQMDKLLKDSGRQITLVTDAWSNIRNESIINYVAVTRKHAVFLKSTPSGKDRHTGVYIADEVRKILEEINPRNVVAITMDNASNMKSAQGLLHAQFPDIKMLGCASHLVNLTVEDLIRVEEVAAAFSDVIEVIKYFKNSYIHSGTLDEISQGRRKALQLPGNTRWQGKYNAVESLLANRDFIEVAVGDPSTLLPPQPTPKSREDFDNISQSVLNPAFWEKTRNLARFLKPFLDVTIALEGVQPKASRIFAYFQFLAQTCHATTQLSRDEILTAIGRRFSQIHDPLFSIAYVCDPAAREERRVTLTNKMWLEIDVYVRQYFAHSPGAAGQVYMELRAIWARTGPFEGQANWESFQLYEDPADWWQAQLCTADTKELAIYALSINPTTGAAERNWSVHGFIHSKTRNRLANKQVERLVYIFTNLRIRDKLSDADPAYFNTSEVADDAEEEEEEDSEGANELAHIEEGMAIARQVNALA